MSVVITQHFSADVAKNSFRIRIETAPDGSWTVTEYRRHSKTILFRGDHSEAVRYADSHVNG